MNQQVKELLRQVKALTQEVMKLREDHADDDGMVPADIAEQIQAKLTEAGELRDKAQAMQSQAALAEQQKLLEQYLDQPGGRLSAEDPAEARGGLNGANRKAARGEGGTVMDDPEFDPVSVLHEVRYGGMKAEVAYLLRDLYGTGYKSNRLEQEKAFGIYLRKGERALGDEQYQLLKGEPILTPTQVEHMVKQGVSFSQVKATLVEAADELGGLTPAMYMGYAGQANLSHATA